MTTRNDIERVLWKACDSFRGKIDSSRYKDYILSMLFVKYLSDVTLEGAPCAWSSTTVTNGASSAP